MRKREFIRLTKADRKKCEEFADARCSGDTKLYEKRGGFKRVDIVAGAMAEIATYKFLRSKGIKVSKPDFQIYEVGSKSYEADLSIGNKKFHVKGQTYQSSLMYGESWLMQKKDPLIRKPVEYPNIKNNYLVPCIVDIGGNNVHILGVPSFSVLHAHHCFSVPTVDRFKFTKVAIYSETLEWALTYNSLWGVVSTLGGKR